MYFVDVILPIPVENAFTYSVNRDEFLFIKPGMRLAVPFGKTKIYTGIAQRLHQQAPTIYEAKEIEHILEEELVIHESQLKFWEWIASYYMCTVGEVMRAALPSPFLLESETIIQKIEGSENNLEEIIDADEQLLISSLVDKPVLKIKEVMDLLGRRKVLPLIHKLVERGILSIEQEIYEAYKPKLIKYVRLHPDYEEESMLHVALDDLSRAPKQRELVLVYFSLKAKTNKPIKAKTLQEGAQASAAQLKALAEKGIFEIYHLRQDRVDFAGGKILQLKELNSYQETALAQIEEHFKEKAVTLLHGVTSSGKTEIYVKLIQKALNEGKQVLYLVPEIALTTQLVSRLKQYFGTSLAVYHSKYSVHEQVEVWNNVLQNRSKAQLVLGARSSLLLPFDNLGLVIVDEEHETSYKQFDPAPRYHARDAAIVLAHQHKAKTLLGSATPSIESYYNATTSKYGLVTLSHRHGDVLMPEQQLVDIQEKYKKKLMTGHFSDVLLRAITDALALGEQVILFQNRRGYSPILECNTCGHSPQCPNCDVSLTYHKHRSQLRCHYCGYNIAMLQKCMACGSAELDTKGFGTEQVENELKELYPETNIGRMDSDTTRGKYGFERIISAFEEGEIDVLVGTQMLTKGLDFRNVTLVGILQADSMLNIPDFRAHERSFQLIQQVSGRAGRTKKRGNVIIQTYNPYHQILQQVSTNSYLEMYKEQLDERSIFKYPPFSRLIKITLKHRDYNKIEDGSEWMGKALKSIFGQQVLGPEAPPIARIRNEFYRHILIKIPHKQSLEKTKKAVIKVKTSFLSIAQFRAIKIILDVDNQ